MECLVFPVSVLSRRFSGFQPLTEGDSDEQVTVVVGREKREFLVDPLVLEENPFRVLIDLVRKGKKQRVAREEKKRVIYVDVDSILFEHMLWLMHNDFSSFFHLNLKEIIDFYAQDY